MAQLGQGGVSWGLYPELAPYLHWGSAYILKCQCGPEPPASAFRRLDAPITATAAHTSPPFLCSTTPSAPSWGSAEATFVPGITASG